MKKQKSTKKTNPNRRPPFYHEDFTQPKPTKPMSPEEKKRSDDYFWWGVAVGLYR